MFSWVQIFDLITMLSKINFQKVKLESPFEGDREKIRSSECAVPLAFSRSDRYFLNWNIYWVKGAKNSVIHDFNLNILYWLNHDTTLFLAAILSERCVIPNAANDIIATFVRAGIITNDRKNSSSGNIEAILPVHQKIKTCYIEITQRCNLKCIHCYNAQANNLSQTLSLDDLIKIVDDVKDYGIDKIRLIGGEPLLIDTLVLTKFLDYASPRFKNIRIFTNGTKINDELGGIISRYTNVDFSIALYSTIEYEHDRFTGIKGSQEKTLNAINILKTHKIPVMCTGIIADKLDVGDIKELGCDYRLDYVRLAGRGSLRLYNEALLRRRLKTLESLNYEWSRRNVIDLYNSRCFSRIIYISSTLDVYPCAMERRLKHGNLKDGNLSEILNESILNYSKNNIEGCKDCEFRYVCFVCPPDSLTGRLNDKPWNCTYDVHRGRWLEIEGYIKSIVEQAHVNNHTVPFAGGCKSGIV